jgi:uncharacterized protein YndB with AHSA1/START domain
MEPITVSTLVVAPRQKVWSLFTDPEHIVKWNSPSADWHTPRATNDLRVGGTFSSRMEAKDGSAGFDFAGTYSEVVPESRYAYAMPDGRKVLVTFEDEAGGTRVTETFDPETQNPPEFQRGGWQAILESFRAHAESQA